MLRVHTGMDLIHLPKTAEESIKIVMASNIENCVGYYTVEGSVTNLQYADVVPYNMTYCTKTAY